MLALISILLFVHCTLILVHQNPDFRIMHVCVKVRTKNLPLRCMLLRLTNCLWQLFSLFDSHSRSLPARAKTRSKKHSSFLIHMKSSFKLKDKGRCTIKSSALKLLLIELFFDISWNHISEGLIGTHLVQNKLCICMEQHRTRVRKRCVLLQWRWFSEPWERREERALCYNAVVLCNISANYEFFSTDKSCPGLPYFLPSFLVYRLCRIKIILQSVLVDTGKKIKGSFEFRSIFFCCSTAAAAE